MQKTFAEWCGYKAFESARTEHAILSEWMAVKLVEFLLDEKNQAWVDPALHVREEDETIPGTLVDRYVSHMWPCDMSHNLCLLYVTGTVKHIVSLNV